MKVEIDVYKVDEKLPKVCKEGMSEAIILIPEYGDPVVGYFQRFEDGSGTFYEYGEEKAFQGLRAWTPFLDYEDLIKQVKQ